MERTAKVYMHELLAGILIENNGKFIFQYDHNYLRDKSAKPISLTLPLTEIPYTSDFLFPFFDGIIPEGWLKEAAIANWKINPKDRFGLLMLCCKETIGAISIVPENNNLQS